MAVNLLPVFRPIGGNVNTTPGTAELRIAPLNFGPGPGNPLVSGPNPRTVSNVVSGSSGDGPEADNGASGWQYIWGQFLDHDIALQQVGGAAIPIVDPSLPGGVINMTRAIRSPVTNTIVNTISGALDGSQVYGSDVATAASLRNADGTMKTSTGNTVPIVGGQFVSGDVRVGENPELVAVTSLFVREHNWWVGQLKAQHRDWAGDQLYNMAKAICTAEMQNITYSQYLPAVLGTAAPQYHGFNAAINPEATQEFTTSAFRFGHSQISPDQPRIDNNGNLLGVQSLADAFLDTPAQVIANGVDALIRNFSSDDAKEVDIYAINTLRNLLFAPPAITDLIAIDIQRERDVGVGSLNQTRVALGLAPYTTFAQITSDPVVQATLAATYGTVDNLDLFIGGLAEGHVNGGEVGQTFGRIIADQFDRLQTGDQFFWRNQAFDAVTRQTIAETTLGDIIERNTGTPAMQQNVFFTQTRVASGALNTVDTDEPLLVIGVSGKDAIISGGTADDTIVAGDGLHQILRGGGGNNVFMFNGPNQHDTIADWHSGDKIQFQEVLNNAHLNIKDFAPGRQTTTVQWGSSMIEIAGAPKIALSDIILPPGTIPFVVHGS